MCWSMLNVRFRCVGVLREASHFIAFRGPLRPLCIGLPRAGCSPNREVMAGYWDLDTGANVHCFIWSYRGLDHAWYCVTIVAAPDLTYECIVCYGIIYSFFPVQILFNDLVIAIQLLKNVLFCCSETLDANLSFSSRLSWKLHDFQKIIKKRVSRVFEVHAECRAVA